MSKYRIEDFLTEYSNYHPRPKPELIKKAYDLAKIAYYGEKRLSGGDWIDHALATTKIVVGLKMDTSSICAAVLHDCYKFGVNPEEIEKELNAEIRGILDNLYSIKNIKGKYKGEYTDVAYSEYLRRLLVTSAKDVRAIVIRLAEKLNSLRTIEELSSEIQKNAVEKAMEIYAPLAEQIGVYDLKWQLEDLAYKLKHPNSYNRHKNIIDSHAFASLEDIDRLVSDISIKLKERGIEFDRIFGRIKKVYSFKKKIDRHIYKYGVSEHEAGEAIKDKVAFMILVNTVEDCYKALDVIHRLYDHDPGSFDDYIRSPKPNGYKSLQTCIEIEAKHFIEVQIRTVEMNEYNEWGPASHYFYKMTGGSSKVSGERKIQTLRQLLKWRDSLLHDKAGVNIEEAEDCIFVFTPKGDIIELPKGSTPIDFAYKIHTNLGDKIGKVLVNGALKSLDCELKSGDVVQVYMNKQRSGPNRDWLNFVKAKEARIAIKKYLNKTLANV